MKRCLIPAAAGLMLVALLMVGLSALRVEAAPLARTTATVREIEKTGTALTYTSAISQMQFSNDGTVFLYINNAYTGTITMTAETPGTVGGLAIADLEVAIASETEKFVGPFRPSLFNQISGGAQGYVYIDFDTVTSVTVGAYRLSND